MIAAGVLERGEFYHKTLYNGHSGEFTKNGIYTTKVEMYAAWSEPQHICAYKCTRIQVHTHQARLRVVKRRS